MRAARGVAVGVIALAQLLSACADPEPQMVPALDDRRNVPAFDVVLGDPPLAPVAVVHDSIGRPDTLLAPRITSAQAATPPVRSPSRTPPAGSTRAGKPLSANQMAVRERWNQAARDHIQRKARRAPAQLVSG